MATIVKCPACGKPVPWSEASLWRPFCSERCKINDLGDWAANRHVIAGSPAAAAADEVPSTDDQGSGRH